MLRFEIAFLGLTGLLNLETTQTVLFIVFVIDKRDAMGVAAQVKRPLFLLKSRYRVRVLSSSSEGLKKFSGAPLP